MTRVLVAGIGNVFYRDDGFGVEVARRLAASPPPGIKVNDFGIRALHLAYELLDSLELCVIADCMARGGEPGTIYVLEPELVGPGEDVADAHAMTVGTVFAMVRRLGGCLPRTLIVGCEPEDVGPGMGLGHRVDRAVEEAVGVIRELVTAHRGASP